MIEGIIKNVSDKSKGFGFIIVDGYDRDVFFHATECAGVEFEQLRKNDKVTIREITETARGYTASGISLAK